MPPSTPERWNEVDRYFEGLFPADPPLERMRVRAREAGLPDISVTPAQGRLLAILARLAGAGQILEVGTLGGYSAAWLARGLAPGGKVTTLELSERNAAVARASLAEAGLGDAVEVVVGPGLESMQRLATAAGAGRPYDLVFLDADKSRMAEYLELAVRLTRVGGVIVADNVVREGRVLEEAPADADLRGVQAFNAAFAADGRLLATAFQQVSAKGWDGIAVAVVTA